MVKCEADVRADVNGAAMPCISNGVLNFRLSRELAAHHLAVDLNRMKEMELDEKTLRPSTHHYLPAQSVQSSPQMCWSTRHLIGSFEGVQVYIGYHIIHVHKFAGGNEITAIIVFQGLLANVELLGSRCNVFWQTEQVGTSLRYLICYVDKTPDDDTGLEHAFSNQLSSIGTKNGSLKEADNESSREAIQKLRDGKKEEKEGKKLKKRG